MILAVTVLMVLLAGLIGCTRPAPVRPSATAVARDTIIRVSGLDHYFLAASRTGFDAIQHAVAGYDQREIALVFRLYETIPVVNGQPVRVLEVRDDAANVELLDGPHLSRQGWIFVAFLDP